MPTRYCDPLNGNDANTGTNWTTDAVKTITRLSALSAPGDENRILASPTGDSGIDATWPTPSASGARNVAVNTWANKVALITDCLSSSGWVAAGGGDVTLSYQTTHTKFGTGGKLRLTFDSTPQANTLQAYCPIGGSGGLDLSAYQAIECWAACTAGTMPASSLVIKLCSDTAGAVPVDTLTFAEASAGTNLFVLCIRGGVAFGNAIRSIAIYTGATAPAASSAWNFDCFYATNCQVNGNPGLCKFLHKPFPAQWQPSTAYSVGARRMPTFAFGSNRLYQCTTAGTSGTTEPNWDTAYHKNDTITDGTCVWTCIGCNEAFLLWPVKSFNVSGLTFEIDNHTNNVGNAGRGYWGTAETTDLYCLEPYRTTMIASGNAQNTTVAGTDAAPIIWRGGYATNNTVVGITVFDGRNSLGNGISNLLAFHRWYNIWPCRYVCGFDVGTQTGKIYRLIGTVASGTTGLLASLATSCEIWYPTSVNVSTYFGLTSVSSSTRIIIICTLSVGALYRGCDFRIATLNLGCLIDVVEAYNNAVNFVALAQINVMNLSTEYCSTGQPSVQVNGMLLLQNATIAESAEFLVSTGAIYSFNHDGVAGAHKIAFLGGYADYNAATKIWTAYVTSAACTSQVCATIRVGQVYCDVANTQYTVSLVVTPSNAAIFGRLRILAQSLRGINSDVTATSSGAWGQTLAVQFTPTETGLVDVYLDIFVSSGTTHNLQWDETTLSCRRGLFTTRVWPGVFLNGLPSTLAMPYTDVYPTEASVLRVADGGPAAWGPNGTGYGPGTAIAEAHSANQILKSAGGNWNDDNLGVGGEANVKEGVAFGLSQTGTYTGAGNKFPVFTSAIINGGA